MTIGCRLVSGPMVFRIILCGGLTSNDVSSIGQSLKEIEAYEDFHRGTPEEDPEEDFETIRRQRKAI